MTSSDINTPPKRLHILDDEEIEALYGRPCFDDEDRTIGFTLTNIEKDILTSLKQLHAQIYFILQLGYFKAKQSFFTFTFQDVIDDVAYILHRYFPDVLHPKLRQPTKVTILKQRGLILKLFEYKLCTPLERKHLFERAKQAAQISSKPIYIFRELLHYLIEHRLVIPGYTVLQEAIIGKALTAETQRLTVLLQLMLSDTQCTEINNLFADTEGIHPITLLKRQPKDFSLGEMRDEISRGKDLLPLYQLAIQIVPQLGISSESVNYYASLVSYYSVFRLNQLAEWIVYLYLLCFIVHRYQRWNDNLLTCFIHLVNQYGDETKATIKQTVYDHRLINNQDLPRAGEVLKLFATDDALDKPFHTIQMKAFNILDRQRLTNIADYIVNEAKFDEIALGWEHIDIMARRFKQHLRPILRAINLSATHTDEPILEVVEFLKSVFQKNRSLKQIDLRDFPTDFIPVRDRRYIYQRDETSHKQLIPDRYEFLVYRMLRNRLEAGDIFCQDSVRFRSFDDDLLDDLKWVNKDNLIAQTGLSILKHPIKEHLVELEKQLEERIVAVNRRIETGENSHFQVTNKGKRKGWTLKYPTSSEPINHPVFETLNQVNIGSVLHFVNHHCQFMSYFEHILGRYRKQVVNNHIINACLVAWATNMGLGRMGEISDISESALASTSENFLRLETLKAANDCVSNAIATIPIFRQYDIGGVIHSSSDGQKFETGLPSFNARYSPKYFGTKKGVVAYTLVGNHVPVNADMIGAHDHESQFVFDLLFNNTTDIHPEIHSTDTHGTNQVNFALLYIGGYQFAPRYKGIQDKIRTSLYGFHHPNYYGDILLKPVRKLNIDLIIEEWDNLQRIFVSLALKTTTQSIIVSKLSSYARKNKTRQALWEYDNILSSLYLLDFVDSPILRKNVQQALNRGESYHQLRRAVSYANFGKLRYRSEDDQYLWHECSRLITNCIIFYNMTILSELWARKKASQDIIGAARIIQISPVAWQHINFYGRYEFTKRSDLINVGAIVDRLVQHPIVLTKDNLLS